MKKLMALFLTLAVCAGAFCFSASAAESGSFGDLAWSLQDGVLTISGNGDMEELGMFSPEQWLVFADDITSVVIENGVTRIGNFAFLGCDNLVSVSLPEGLTEIGEFAFQSCDVLTDIELPQSLQTIKTGAFTMCGITEITVPASVTTFEEAVFEACTALETVVFECTLTEIGAFTFADCDSLTTVYYSGTEAEWNAIVATLDEDNAPLLAATVICSDTQTGGDEESSADLSASEEAGDVSVSEDAILESGDESGDLAVITVGDVNFDGGIDSLDAAAVLKFDAILISLSDDAQTAADVNGDGSVDSLDAAQILKFDAGLIQEF